MNRFERTDRNYTSEWYNVENYEKAKADNFEGWICHHRLETHNSDGERRTVDLSREELLALSMYFDRHASELIFLTRGEHMRIHQIGKFRDADTWKVIREKVSKALKGKHQSKDAIAKSAEARKGQLWYNNGVIETRAFRCPEGFVKGRLKNPKCTDTSASKEIE